MPTSARPVEERSQMQDSRAVKNSVDLAPSHVVCLGASAGGLDAIKRFFKAMPADSGMAFVVVPHLSADHKSVMAELISKDTQMTVVPAGDEMPVLRNRVYMMQPQNNLVIVNRCLHQKPREKSALLNLPVDLFLKSSAQDQGDRAVAIILSGTGRDGGEGAQAVKLAGGLVIAQDSTAQFNGMPRNVVGAGLADYVLAPEQMPAVLMDHAAKRLRRDAHAPRMDTPSEPVEKVLARILSLLNHRHGIDFQQYKMSTVMRRIQRRMSIVQCSDVESYERYLQEHPREVAELNSEMLIGVTRFFRDPEAFEILADKVIPEIARMHTEGAPTRIWVCGCSRGEEAYSIALLFAEYEDVHHVDLSVQIFATDIDQDAISFADAGLYPASIGGDVSEARLSRFFQREGEGYRVGRVLRSKVEFAVHNVIKDPPFTALHLIACRNLLIYLDTAAQKRCLSLFDRSLLPGGFLFLGPSEAVGDLASSLRSIAGRWKVFRGDPNRSRMS